MPSLKRQFYLALAEAATWPEPEYRQFIAEAKAILQKAQGKALLSQALGPGWKWPGDVDAGGPPIGR